MVRVEKKDLCERGGCARVEVFTSGGCSVCVCVCMTGTEYLVGVQITVSTVGLVPEIEAFAQSSCAAQLAVSLHATNDALRSSLMPVNRRYNLNSLMTALR
jgi:hypothetical protein